MSMPTWGKRPTAPGEVPALKRRAFKSADEFVHWVEPGKRVELELPLELHIRLNEVCSQRGVHLHELIEQTLVDTYPARPGEAPDSGGTL